MILSLDAKQYLRLSKARGATVEVLDGRVWITEAGRERDALMARGMRYSVAGDGLVVVGTDTGADLGTTRIELQSPVWRRLWRGLAGFASALAAGLHERWTIAQLEELSDRSLRDIGLRRDQIASAARRSTPG